LRLSGDISRNWVVDGGRKKDGVGGGDEKCSCKTRRIKTEG